ncbi:MAG: glycine-rich domain-containing protein [Pseudonocardiaceae bacterium]
MSTTIAKGVPGTATLTNKSLIPDRLFTLLVDRIVKDWHMKRDLAERIMDQTLGFLRLLAEDPDQTYSPSAQVDIGWHVFILHTRAYTAFCDELAGRYLHHTPYNEDEVDVAKTDCGPCGPCHSNERGLPVGVNNLRRTVEAMTLRGIVTDGPLWTQAPRGT